MSFTIKAMAVIFALHSGKRTHFMMTKSSLLCLRYKQVKWTKIPPEKRVLLTPIGQGFIDTLATLAEGRTEGYVLCI